MTTRTSTATPVEWCRCYTTPAGGDASAGLPPAYRPYRPGTIVPRGGCLGDRSGAAVARAPRRAGPDPQSVPTGARARPAARLAAGRPGGRFGAPVDAPPGGLGGAGGGRGDLRSRVAQAPPREEPVAAR